MRLPPRELRQPLPFSVLRLPQEPRLLRLPQLLLPTVNGNRRINARKQSTRNCLRVLLFFRIDALVLFFRHSGPIQEAEHVEDEERHKADRHGYVRHVFRACHYPHSYEHGVVDGVADGIEAAAAGGQICRGKRRQHTQRAYCETVLFNAFNTKPNAAVTTTDRTAKIAHSRGFNLLTLTSPPFSLYGFFSQLASAATAIGAVIPR